MPLSLFGSSRKDTSFFDAFSQHAETSAAAARILLDVMTRLEGDGDADGERAPYVFPAREGVDQEIKALAAKIKDAETTGDTITHETMKRLRENWLTPLDRGDIHELITRMDDVLDSIEEAAERIVLFEIRVAPPEARELVRVLVSSCEAIAKAVGLLRSMAHAPEILKLCVEVNQLENDADALHRKAIAAMFKKGNEPLMVMKWRDIFDSLESAADRCEDVANVLEGVVLEYA
jgi:uncharacterized protein